MSLEAKIIAGFDPLKNQLETGVLSFESTILLDFLLIHELINSAEYVSLIGSPLAVKSLLIDIGLLFDFHELRENQKRAESIALDLLLSHHQISQEEYELARCNRAVLFRILTRHGYEMEFWNGRLWGN